MTLSEHISQVTDPRVIRDHLNWHEKQGQPVVLLMASCEDHVRAKVTGLEADGSGLMVVCTGVGDVAPGQAKLYSLIGTTAKGANFMASGKMQPYSGSADCFKLSFPECIDISQSRDCHRSPAPPAHFLHFSAADPYLNDIVCKAKDVSLGGLAVVWNGGERCKPPAPGSVANDALFVGGRDIIQLGRLRVVHTTASKHHVLLGLKFENPPPREYGKLVLNAQRSQYFA